MNDNEYLKKLGLKIKILRTLKNLSQDDISNKLDIDKIYLSKLERGLANPSLVYLKHLSEIFEISLSELVDSGINI